jgi:hypothetical protein
LRFATTAACRQKAFTKEALKGKPGPFGLQR